MFSDAQFRDLVSGRWQGPLAALLRGATAVLEYPYRWAVQRRNARFDRDPSAAKRFPAPVISVGNLTVGGTGKTPMVAWLARWFLARNSAVTIISRGYGSRGGRPNDEALELAARLPNVPHLQNPDRCAAAAAALAANPRQVLILDDAFQHRRLARDLDIVLLDALAPFGYERLLPRGLLREPVDSLARAHVIALSRSDAVDEATRREIEAKTRRLATHAIWLELVHEPTNWVSGDGNILALDALRGQRVGAFCGIGNPAGFRATLKRCGVEIAGWLELSDHCDYSGPEMARLLRWLEPLQVDTVICTRKDLVKIHRDEIGGKRLLALEIELSITRGREAFESALAQLETAVCQRKVSTR